MVRQISRNDDRGIDELLSTSISELFPEDHKRLDKSSNHTIESTEREDDDCDGSRANYVRKIKSFEQCDGTGDLRLAEVTDEEDSDNQSLKFGDIFPEYQPEIDDSFVDRLEESFAQVVCDEEVQNLRKEQRKKVIKALFAPMKSLVKPVRNLPGKIHRITNPIHLPDINFRNNKRKLTRVTFAERPTYVVEESDECSDFTSEEFYLSEKFCSTWYNDEDYDTWKKDVLETMEKIVRCHQGKKDFVETDHETARGLELVTKEMILDRKQYKIASRHIVFDEQEEQRLSRTNDPEKIRELYVDATSKARVIALEYGWKDQEVIHKLNTETCCINEESSH